MPFRGTLVENASRQGGGLGGIREECRYRFCYLPPFFLGGWGWGRDRRKKKNLQGWGGTVLLFPDADAYAEWKQRAESMYFCKVVVSDIIERNATPKQKEAHIDIADWIIFQIREGKVMSTANHLVEAERILQRMIEKNPVLQKLIDDLDLVLVGASPIGNDDEKPP